MTDEEVYNEEVYNQLLRDRIVFLDSQIDADLTNLIVAQLLFLAEEDAQKILNESRYKPGQ